MEWCVQIYSDRKPESLDFRIKESQLGFRSLRFFFYYQKKSL